LSLLLLTAAACRDSSDTATETETETEATAGGDAATETASGDFGSLTNVCQDGDGGGATAQGVTAEAIQLGVLTDFGFTQNREFIDTAEAFTSWCNAAGGINGRELTFQPRDAELFQYRQRILEACREDFMLVGGGASFDNNGARDRLQCLLPEVAAQVVSPENSGADLQVQSIGYEGNVDPYEAYFRWLLEEAFPGSGEAVGIIAGDVGVTQIIAAQETETFTNLGANLVYNDVYPASGVADWTPYAQALKSAGVQGLVFLGSFSELAKLEQALTDIGHTLAWIDANSNAYNSQFIELAASVLDEQPNFAPLPIVPLEAAADNPATQELIDVFAEHAPDAAITGPAIQAWSAWLLFAVAARDCGADVTRRCVFDNLTAITEWDGGGLQRPANPNDRDNTPVCFHAVQATSAGWESADFGPNEGLFRCAEAEFEFQGDYGQPLTLEQFDLSLDDLE
jgi:hypothetical protein